MQQGDEFGHARHFYGAGPPDPDAAAHHEGKDKHQHNNNGRSFRGVGKDRDNCGNKGQQHPDGAQDIAFRRGFLFGQPG